jgi:hypothetical protein
MTNPDYRALCAELVNELSAYKVAHPQHDDDLLTRARALLAAPEAVGVANAQIDELAEEYLDGDRASVRDFARAVLSRYGTAHPSPVPVGERLPEPGVKILAHYLNSHGKSRTVCARWIPAKFYSDDSDLYGDDFLEYDEDSDICYLPEGWYEVIENWDDYGSFIIHEGEVTHWQPLPHWALPVPAP